MANTTKNNSIPGLDFVLVVGAAAAIIKLNYGSDLQVPFIELGIPILYLILSTLLTGADLPSAAGRGYLLCFLTSLVTLIVGVDNVSSQLSAIQVDPANPQAAQQLLLSAASDLVPKLLMPLGLGVIIYAASSVFEISTSKPVEDDSRTEPSQLIDRIASWVEQQGASSTLVEYIKTVLQTTEQLGAACQTLGSQASQAHLSFTSLNQAAANSEQSLNSVARCAGVLDEKWKHLDEDLIRISASVDQLGSAVTQIGRVVDEMSEILSKKILVL